MKLGYSVESRIDLYITSNQNNKSFKMGNLKETLSHKTK